MCVCGGGGGVCPSTCVKAREQLVGVGFLFLPYGPGIKLRSSIRLGDKLLYSLSHVVGPRIINFYKWPFQTIFFLLLSRITLGR